MLSQNHIAVALAGFLIAGCTLATSDDPEPSVATTTRFTTTTPTTAALSTTTTIGAEPEMSTTTGQAGPSQACLAEPDVDIDPGALSPSVINGDLDGDGYDDHVTGYLLGSSDVAQANAAVLHVELASGWGTNLVVNELAAPGSGPSMAIPRAVVEITDQRMLVAGVRGILPGILESFFVLRDCELVVVTAEDGSIPGIWSGGGAAHTDWPTCRDDRVLMNEFWIDDPQSEPRQYLSGTVLEHIYRDGSFAAPQEATPEVMFPATEEELLVAYPNCVAPGL